MEQFAHLRRSLAPLNLKVVLFERFFGGLFSSLLFSTVVDTGFFLERDLK